MDSIEIIKAHCAIQNLEACGAHELAEKMRKILNEVIEQLTGEVLQ